MTTVATHGDWEVASDRPDPVALLEEQNEAREPDLVPVRHGRMSASAFTFFRGAAKIMAEDLARAPASGLVVQLCGDAHLSNFGVFASPERRLVFDINDFDETLPGPFEYDVKRLASSFAVAAKHNGFSKSERTAVVRSSVTAYREAVAAFAGMSTMQVWYAHRSEKELRRAAREMVRGMGDKRSKGAEALARARRSLAKARRRDSMHALAKLAEVVDDEYRIVSRPPTVVRLEELASSQGRSIHEVEALVQDQFAAYRASLPDDRQALLSRFRVVDVARKVVGVGSVGTRAFIVLLEGRDKDDALFLQAKEATRSVLEGHLPSSRYACAGERVVQGQRLMQSVSDIFLGWSGGEPAGRDYYFRQLRDMKGSAMVEGMAPAAMTFYADVCGWTLARAHARSGDAIAIAAYLSNGDFDEAVTRFASRYEKQNRRDFDAFRAAIGSGRLQARTDL